MDHGTGNVELLTWGADQTSISVGLESAPGGLAVAVGALEAARVDPGRSQHRSRVLRFCQEHPDALYRSCLAGHLTGSGFVVDAVSKSVLLIRHRKLQRWLQPGGHADGEGNLGLVALNEVQEETGLGELKVLMPAFDVDVHHIPARPGEPAHYHHDLRFVMVADRSQHLELADGEVSDGRWFTVDAPELVADPELHEVAARAVAIVDALGLDAG